MNKRYFDSRNAHFIMAFIGLVIFLMGASSVNELVKDYSETESATGSVIIMLFGGAIFGAGLQSLFRVRKQHSSKKRDDK